MAEPAVGALPQESATLAQLQIQVESLRAELAESSVAVDTVRSHVNPDAFRAKTQRELDADGKIGIEIEIAPRESQVRLDLELVGEHRFTSGAVHLRYAVRR